jgi:hypothetical protein
MGSYTLRHWISRYIEYSMQAVGQEYGLWILVRAAPIVLWPCEYFPAPNHVPTADEHPECEVRHKHVEITIHKGPLTDANVRLIYRWLESILVLSSRTRKCC